MGTIVEQLLLTFFSDPYRLQLAEIDKMDGVKVVSLQVFYQPS